MSNLLKDASILLTPTGYDNGSMNAIKPENGDGDFQFSRNSAATRVNAQGLVENVQILSSNLVSNGDFSQEGVQEVSNGSFDTDTKWTTNTGWSISGGSANCDGTQPANATLVQQNGIKGAIIDFVVGKTYKVNFDIVVTSGNITNIEVASGYDGNDITTSGNHTTYITAVSTNDRFTITGNPDFIGSIDNVSVKEVGQDWTLGTGWSIGEDKVIANSTSININQFLGNKQGVKLLIKFDVDFVSGSYIKAEIGGAFGDSISTSGRYSTIITPISTAGYLYIYGGNFTGTITNISVLEITDDTNLPRINYEGFSYQDSLGSEEVVNGDFATDTNWNIGSVDWTISNGFAVANNSNNVLHTSASVATSINLTYKVKFDISDATSGYVRVGLNVLNATQFNSNGTQTLYIVSSGNNYLYFNPSNFTGKITNVSVKEVLGQEVVPNSGCGSWLLEPQSTNLINYSEDFSDVSWVKENVTVQSNTETSPSGQLNASYVIPDIGSGLTPRITYVFSSQSGVTYQASVFVKKFNTDWIRLLSTGATSDTVQAYYDISNGVIGTGGSPNLATIEDYGNGWYRLGLKIVSTNTSSGATFRVQFAGGDNNPIITTDGTEKFICWGAMLEQQSFATSYIPTQGATSTRLQDIATNSGNASLINSEEGVLYAEISIDTTLGVGSDITLIDSSNTADFIRFTNDGGTNKVNMYFRYNGVSNFHTFIGDTTIFKKYAIQWGNGEVNYYVNGVLKETDFTTMPTLNVFDKLHFSNTGSSNRAFTGDIKALAVFKTALTDASLRSLTYPPAVATTFDLDFDTIAEQFTFTRGSEATFVNAQGLIQSTASNDAPRLDYSTGAEAFLLEPQSTNLVQYSEDFGQSYWRKLGNPTITDNQVESPNGDLTADLFEATENSSRIDLNNVLLSAITYTASIYVKSSGSGSNSFKFYAFGGTQNIFSATNEWVKYSFTVTPSYTTALVFEALNTNTSVYIWGAQLEQQSYATSYIPTSGASATRNQELCNNATPVINSEEGTLYAEIEALTSTQAATIMISISNGSTNAIKFGYQQGANVFFVESTGTANGIGIYSEPINPLTYSKVALSYKENDVKLYINGVLEAIDTSFTAFAPDILNTLNFDSGTGASKFFGNTKGLKYYPKALADVQLEDLTTI